MGLRLIWLGTKGFLVTNDVFERAKDSRRLLPSTVTVPLGKSLSIVSVTGPSLQTLQHQRKSLAGGPKVSMLSLKPVPPAARWSLRPFILAKRSTYSSVSGNSRPVSMLMRSTLPHASMARAHAASESLPPEKDTVTGRWLRLPSSMNLRISWTARLWILRTCPLLQATNVSRPAFGDTGFPDGAFRSRILTARSALRREPLSQSDTPGPTLPPFRRMSGSPSENVPTTSVTLAPGTTLPLRCPDIPAKRTMERFATGASSSAPCCLSSRTMRARRMSYLMTATTAPWATISSARSSPGILLRNIALPLRGASVPKASRNSASTMSTESPMHGRMSPGLLILNCLPSEPHTEHESPSSSVPQASHHLSSSFPWAV